MKKTCLVLCMFVSLPVLAVLAGSGPIVANNSDLLYVRGPGELQLVTGTLVYKHKENGEVTALYSRNQSTLHIEVTAENGTYWVETWSIAPNQMWPERVHQGMEVVIGDGDTGPSGPIGENHVLALLAAWGPCSGSCQWDFNGDGVVDVFDLLYLLTLWGT